MDNIEPKLKYVDTGKLKGAKFNPTSRYEKNAGTMVELIADIKRVGVLTPLMVVADDGKDTFLVADGHRRLSAALVAGIPRLPCIVIQGMTLGEVYRRQFITRRPSGQEVLSVYLAAKDAVSPKHSRQLQRWEAILGREKLEEYARRGASLNTLKIVRSLDKYLAGSVPVPMKYGSAGDPERLGQLADWLIGQRQQGEAWRAMRLKYDGRSLWVLIRHNGKLSIKGEGESKNQAD